MSVYSWLFLYLVFSYLVGLAFQHPRSSVHFDRMNPAQVLCAGMIAPIMGAAMLIGCVVERVVLAVKRLKEVNSTEQHS